ncbi:MAG TPA: iron-sulfur cluster repair di-iron protein [Pyrinomonadaceae bacterium]|nr:iron-sulfur cluster repair di-iron protein [Pyrinomonadaceae bacterium]
MTLQTTKTVRELALEIPGATRVFERLGIDYCCGGAKSLADACATRSLSAEEVIEQLKEEGETSFGAVTEAKDFTRLTMTELISYIVNKHHAFTRQELQRLDALVNKVCSVHGESHGELLKVQALFRELAADLQPHMLKEEMVLFPYVMRLEEAVLNNQPAPAPPPFMTVRNPVRMMSLEHDTAGDLLRGMREASSDYMVPADACFSYRTLYRALEEFEQDLHQHIHLENNILFPRAIELEDASNS